MRVCSHWSLNLGMAKTAESQSFLTGARKGIGILVVCLPFALARSRLLLDGSFPKIAGRNIDQERL